VTSFDADTFKIGVAPETLRRTNLGSLKEGSKVNLERAVLGSTRMGGHFVQGHVDTIATVTKVTPDGNALTFRFSPRDKKMLNYVIEKGFIAIDGASLTVTAVQDGPEGWWEVMLIAYTQDRIVTAAKREGDEVNVEVDMVGKYVEKNVMKNFLTIPQSLRTEMEAMVETMLDERLGKRP
jgi:riboflavin synthase